MILTLTKYIRMETCVDLHSERRGTAWPISATIRKEKTWLLGVLFVWAESLIYGPAREEPDEVLTGYVEQRSKIHRHRMQSTKQLCLGPKSWSSGCGKMILCRGRLYTHCTEGLGERCLKEGSSRIAQPPPPFSSKGAQGWGCGDAQALTGSLTNGSVINADGRISKSH